MLALVAVGMLGVVSSLGAMARSVRVTARTARHAHGLF